jgi:alkylhydroperoxidase/carboxymuconolactone decarboxylase family protein YurZ
MMGMATSNSWRERHDSAAETFRAFVPGVDPERVAASFARRQGALGSMAFDVVGAMWSRPQLNRRDRSLLVISALAAQAWNEELELHTGNGLRNGLTPEEIEEILLHVAAYAVFSPPWPRAGGRTRSWPQPPTSKSCRPARRPRASRTPNAIATART